MCGLDTAIPTTHPNTVSVPGNVTFPHNLDAIGSCPCVPGCQCKKRPISAGQLRSERVDERAIPDYASRALCYRRACPGVDDLDLHARLDTEVT